MYYLFLDSVFLGQRNMCIGGAEPGQGMLMCARSVHLILCLALYGIVHTSVLCACLRVALGICLHSACVWACGRLCAHDVSSHKTLPAYCALPLAAGWLGGQGGLGAAVQARFGVLA